MNRWLLYQTVVAASGRAALYQAGGAFGFGSTPGCLSSLHARPGLTRKQILLHAAHQYKRRCHTGGMRKLVRDSDPDLR